MVDGVYICKGCGRHESQLVRERFKGPLYKDTLNKDPYCIKCSGCFYKMDQESRALPDGVVREQ